jgi:hypothetical protein
MGNPLKNISDMCIYDKIMPGVQIKFQESKFFYLPELSDLSLDAYAYTFSQPVCLR